MPQVKSRGVARRLRVEEEFRAQVLPRHGGLTKRAAAEALGLSSGAAVSWRVRKLHIETAADRDLKQAVRRSGDQPRARAKA